MAAATPWSVTRRPGAPPRRAGREWPEGESTALDLDPATVEQLRADLGYAVALADPKTAPQGGVASRARKRPNGET